MPYSPRNYIIKYIGLAFKFNSKRHSVIKIRIQIHMKHGICIKHLFPLVVKSPQFNDRWPLLFLTLPPQESEVKNNEKEQRSFCFKKAERS